MFGRSKSILDWKQRLKQRTGYFRPPAELQSYRAKMAILNSPLDVGLSATLYGIHKCKTYSYRQIKWFHSTRKSNQLLLHLRMRNTEFLHRSNHSWWLNWNNHFLSIYEDFTGTNVRDSSSVGVRLVIHATKTLSCASWSWNFDVLVSGASQVVIERQIRRKEWDLCRSVAHTSTQLE